MLIDAFEDAVEDDDMASFIDGITASWTEEAAASLIAVVKNCLKSRVRSRPIVPLLCT